MNTLTLDLANVKTEEEFHDLASSVFEFPHYYGRNLDAFWDCITEIFDPTNVRVLHLESLSEDIRPTIERYIYLLQEYATQRKEKFSVDLIDNFPIHDSPPS
jgi:ribonuclease inhibitor